MNFIISKNRFFIFILFLVSVQLFGQDDHGTDHVRTLFDQYVRGLRPEQVYVSIDKSKYISGETIWFNAFLKNFDLKNDSSIIYVDLINPNNEVIYTKVLSSRPYRSNSYFDLADTLGSGIYLLRAYTNWMKNFDQNLHFRKAVLIMNREYRFKTNRAKLKMVKDETVSWTKSHYKIAEKQDEVFDIKINSNPPEIEIQLLNNSISYGSKHYLLAYQDRRIIYLDTISFQSNEEQKILKHITLPNGLIYFVLFNNRYETVGETSCFIKSKSSKKDLYSYQIKGDSVTFVFSEKLRNGRYTFSALSGSNKSSYHDVNDYLRDQFGQAQLPSKMNSQNFDINKFNQIRFYLSRRNSFVSWGDLSLIHDADMLIPYEDELMLSGYLYRDLMKTKKKRSKVMLTVLSEYYDSIQTTTDQNAFFEFRNLKYEDSVEVMLEAFNSRRRNSGYFHLDEMPESANLFMPEYYWDDEIPFLDQAYKEFKASGDPHQINDGRYRLYKYPDHSIDVRKEKKYASNVFEAVKGRAPGMRIVGTPGNYHAFLKGADIFNPTKEALYLIDGVDASSENMNRLSMDLVDKIEIVTNPGRTAVYGIRGHNGIISVFTNRKESQHWGKYVFTMLGYASSKKYQASEIEYEQYQKYDIPFCIYWNANSKSLPERLTLPLPNGIREISVQIEGLDADM